MIITLEKPIEKLLVQEEKTTISEITIVRMIDNPNRKKVLVDTKENGTIILWEGDAYDAIGQWKDSDVIERIKEIIK